MWGNSLAFPSIEVYLTMPSTVQLAERNEQKITRMREQPDGAYRVLTAEE
jgi:hypothetical protein